MPNSLYHRDLGPQVDLTDLFDGATSSYQIMRPYGTSEVALLAVIRTPEQSAATLRLLDVSGAEIGSPIAIAEGASDTLDISFPHLTALDDGRFQFVAQFEQVDDAGGRVTDLRSMLIDPATGDVSEPQTLMSFESFGRTDIKQILTFGDGSVLVTSFSNDDYLGKIQRFAADGTPQGDRFEFPPESYVYSTHVTPLADGRAIASWQERETTMGSDASVSHVKFQMIEADGTTPLPPVTVRTLAEDGTMPPYTNLFENGALEFPDGSFAILWTREEIADGNQSLFAHVSRYNADATANGDAEPLGQMHSILEARGFADGSFALLYHDTFADGEIRYLRSGPDGESRASLFATPYQSDAKLLASGGAVAIWSEAARPNADIETYSRVFLADGRPEGPPVLLTGARPGSSYAEILTAPDDRYLVNWIGNDGTRFYKQRRPVDFRDLTDGDDTETLAEPGAVDAGAGNDHLTGSDGTDRLIGGIGNDTLAGGAGDDVLSGGAGENLIDGGDGEDAVYFGAMLDSFGFETDTAGETVTITGADGRDEIRGVEHFVFSDQSLTIDQALDVAGFFDETITGTDGADTLSGGLGADQIDGGPGDDMIDGGEGDDTVLGADGNDTLAGGDGADQINGGDGDDVITGGATGADRRDVIFGGAGNDSIDAGHGNDQVFGMDGDDTIAGGFGADDLQGQNGNDVITGSAFSDQIFGGEGDDFVNGGFGHDRINGGAGADRFYHLGTYGHGSDWVQDFSTTEGDVLLFGQPRATARQFQVNFTHTANRDTGERAGDDDVEEAFVIYRPTGQILWALVDGAGLDAINLQVSGESAPFDLLA